MAIRVEITGAPAEVLSDIRRLGDWANLVNLAEPLAADLVDAAMGDELEQLGKVREALAVKTLDLDRARIELGDAKSSLAIAEETIAVLRTRVDALDEQLHVDARLIQGLREKIKNSLTAGPSVGSPPRTSLGSVVSDVRPEDQLFKEGSPASSGQEAARDERDREGRENATAAAEAERGADRALPEPREPERAAQVGAEGGDHHGSHPDAARRPGRLYCGPVRAEPDRDVLRPGDAVQPGAEGGALELAAENLTTPTEGKESTNQAVNVALDTRDDEAGPLNLPKGETAAENEEEASKESPLIVGAAVQPPLPHFQKRLAYSVGVDKNQPGSVAIESLQCEAPDCGNPGEEDSKSGGRFCPALHLGLDLSIRREFHFAKHPELKKSRRKIAPEKQNGAKP